MFPQFRSRPLWGDAVGGLTAGLITLPSAVAYGALAFAPLGPDAMILGVSAGLIGLIVLNLVSASLGAVPFVQSGPILLASLTIASGIPPLVHTAGQHGWPIIPLVFFMLFLAGSFQWVMGLLKAGTLLKYIPHPVVAGLINGTLVAVFLRQWQPVLGLHDPAPSMGSLARFEPLTLLVALVTSAVYLLGLKVRKFPPALTALAVGALAYHALAHSGFGQVLSNHGLRGSLGPLLGPLPGLSGNFGGVPGILRLFPQIDAWMAVAPMALALAAITSLHSLVNLVSVDSLGSFKNDANRELVAQGVGNGFSALMGGLTGAVLFQRTQACHEAGGRTIYSRLANGASILLLVAFGGGILAFLPKVAVSAFLLVFCFTALDPWSLKQGRKLFKGGLGAHGIIDLGIMAVVLLCLVMFGIFWALLAGIFLAVLMVLVDSSRGIIRDLTTGKALRSNVERPAHDLAHLRDHGDRIQVATLEGMLFFGTSDRVRRLAEDAVAGETRVLILDGRRVSKVDATGAVVLEQMLTRLRPVGKWLVLSGFRNVPDELSAVPGLPFFPSLNGALSWAEDHLLQGGSLPEIPLKAVDALAQLNTVDHSHLIRFVARKTYSRGEVIFRKGQPGDAVYYVVKGRAEVYLGGEGQGVSLGERLSEICAGTAFGEMAILDGSPRTATLVAGTDLIVYRLGRPDLEKLSRLHGRTAIRVTRGLALEISKRLRTANGMLAEIRK